MMNIAEFIDRLICFHVPLRKCREKRSWYIGQDRIKLQEIERSGEIKKKTGEIIKKISTERLSNHSKLASARDKRARRRERNKRILGIKKQSNSVGTIIDISYMLAGGPMPLRSCGISGDADLIGNEVLMESGWEWGQFVFIPSPKGASY